MMQILPGFGGGPGSPAPLPPLPTREDPSIAEARERTRLAQKRRQGRRATIIAGQQSDQTTNLNRPIATTKDEDKSETLG